MRALISILIIIAWLLLGWYYSRLSDHCCEDSAGDTTEQITTKTPIPAATDIIKSKPLDPLTFDWSNAKATTRNGWDSYKTNLLNSIEGEDKLQITGLYRATETNDSKYENLGIARAQEARKLFADMPDDKIELQSLLVDDNITASSKNFESAKFRTLKVTKNIKETANKTLIYFPYNSTQKLNSREVEVYLNDVADRVKTSGETVALSGHTDSFGDKASNKALGQQRAQIVRDYLLGQGVPARQIKTTSAGEDQPVASNKTKAGRAANRRTELTINQ